MTDDQNLRQNDAIVAGVCHVIPATAAIYRFGSTVTAVCTPESDVDVAVLGPGGPIESSAWFELQDRLSAALGREVDLLDLSVASPVLAIQVIASGRLIYDGDPRRRGDFETQALGAYARLNEERRDILGRIAAEGTVYGR